MEYPFIAFFPGPLWPRVVAPVRVLSMGQIEQFWHLKCVQTNYLYYTELLEIEVFDHLTVCKQMIVKLNCL